MSWPSASAAAAAAFVVQNPEEPRRFKISAVNPGVFKLLSERTMFLDSGENSTWVGGDEVTCLLVRRIGANELVYKGENLDRWRKQELEIEAMIWWLIDTENGFLLEKKKENEWMVDCDKRILNRPKHKF